MLLKFSILIQDSLKIQITMKSLFILFLLATSVHVFSQEKAQQVFAAAGDQHSSASATVSWTLGETFTASLSSSSVILNQGFQQGMLTVNSLVEPGMSDLKLRAYPNPVMDILILETDGKQHNYRVINMHGELVLNGNITDVFQEIDFTNLPQGIYLLSVDQKQSHKVIKQ